MNQKHPNEDIISTHELDNFAYNNYTTIQPKCLTHNDINIISPNDIPAHISKYLNQYRPHQFYCSICVIEAANVIEETYCSKHPKEKLKYTMTPGYMKCDLCFIESLNFLKPNTVKNRMTSFVKIDKQL